METQVLTDHDNPAERLHSLLSAYNAYDRNIPALDAWRGVLMLNPLLPPARVMRYLSQVADLTDRVRDEVTDLPHRRRERLTRHLHSIDTSMDYLPQVGGMLAQHFQQYYKPEVLITLEEASDALHDLHPRRLVSRNRLGDIRTEIERLALLLKEDTELDADFRDALRVKLIDVIRFINEVPVRGNAAVEDAFDVATGTVHRHGPDVVRYRGTVVMQHFGLICNSLLLVLNVATAGLELPVAVREALGPADPTVVNVTVNNIEGGETVTSTVVLPKDADDRKMQP